VAYQESLPYEPRLFSLVHELKHHYCDQELLGAGVVHCGDYDANELIEKGAEVFAAEFIYPQAEFAEDLQQHGITVNQASDIVLIKRSCKAKVSYHFIRKRLERLKLISPGQFDGVQFKKLEEQLYGMPFHRRS
jgi:Zn-dependent peptidase ImmA (M78 family)